MSRFFATGSDSESESSSSEEEILQPTQKPGAFAARTFQWSDEEVETKRVVRSAKDRRYDELKNAIKTLKNHKKIKDMANVLSDFEDIGKIYEKAKKVVEKDGIPKFYIRFLVELEDFVSECWEDREGRKAMSKNNAKGLTALRQKLRKYNRDFETELATFRENPQEEDEPDTDEEDEGSDDEGGMGGADHFRKSPAKDAEAEMRGAAEDESDEDSDFWAMSSEDSGSSSDEEGQYKGQLTADYFRKKADDVDEDKKDTKKEPKKERKKKQKDEEGAWEEVKSGAPVAAEKPKMFSKDAEINHEAVFKKLREIIAARGKKGTDRAEQMDLLAELRTIAKAHNLGDAIDVKILFHLIAAVFDYNPNIATCMKVEMWEKCLFYIKEVLAILKTNADDIIVGPDITDDAQKFSEEPPYRVRGSVLSVVERMDEEYIKMLQSCDAHSTEYVDRLKDEKVVCDIIEELQDYMEPRGNTEEICRVYLKMIEHLYYKVANDSDGKDTHEVLDRLCKYIYSKDTTDRIRTRAILWHIYHHAMHDRWFEARDLMLMSHLQDTIQHSDIPTQIMYNRALVQLGLCAFRQGFIKDAHNCLVDIQSSGRAKELLAQGLLLQRQHERTPEQEKIEKRRQMPYHMHINLEMLECVYLVSAMLMEIPYMAAHEFDARRRLISKNFHHVLRVSDRQPLVGPPESMREHVVAASKTMKLGRWKECHDFIINDKMNAKVWDLFLEADRVRGMIKKKIQEESLRTYLFTYSGIYDSLSMITLSEMFELERSKVYSIISKMIINEELMASLDEPSQAVQMHRTEPTRMQSLALQLSEKVSSLVDYSERMMDMKQGLFYHRQGQGGGGYQQTQQGGYGGRGRQQRQGQEGGGYQRNQQGGYGGRGRQQRQGNRY